MNLHFNCFETIPAAQDIVYMLASDNSDILVAFDTGHSVTYDRNDMTDADIATAITDYIAMTQSDINEATISSEPSETFEAKLDRMYQQDLAEQEWEAEKFDALERYYFT